jgi:alpha-L-fucosidase 2
MKMNSRYICALLFVFVLATVASAQTESFNTSTGMMDVDYSGYLSKHDIVYNSPNTNPVWGQMVGNGRVGAMVWSANGITMQVGAVDSSEETAFSGGLLNLYTSPGMDTGYSKYQQRLSLYNGTLTTTYDSNRTVTIMGSPNSEVMGIHVEDSRTNVTSVTLDLSIWDVSQLNGGAVPNITTWRTVSTYADSTGIGLSRGQVDPNNFGYTLAATVEGATFTTQTVNSNDVRLIITPTSSYTIWFTCATRLNAPNHDSVTQAHANLANAVQTGYATILSNFESWWNAFWSKFFVQYSNSSGDADYLENLYYYFNYVIACGTYANYPFHFINADFSAVQDKHATEWGYGYWYWNERDIYNSFLASNHPEILKGLNNLYFRNLSAIEAFTTSRFGFSGAWVPETIGWDGDANGTMDSSYTINIFSSGTEAAQNMYLTYKYTNDSAYLTSVAYPFMRQICIFYVNELSKNSSGQYYMAVSNSHETYWDVKDAITDLTAIRTLFPEAIAEAKALGLDSTLAAQWQNVLNNLVAYPSNGTAYLPNDPPAAATHNAENVVSEMLWPYSVTGIGAPDYSLIYNAYINRPFPYDAPWAPDAIQAARLGLGDSAYNGMITMLEKYQNYPNGRTNNTSAEFEPIGILPSEMNEQLLQSYNDVIRVFPAQPSDTSFVSSFTLAAKDGFLVSSERDSSGIKYVGIDSLYGNTASIFNPWGTQAIDVRNMATSAVILTSSSAEFSFPTTANTVYVVERASKPFSGYAHLQLTGSPNNSAKSLAGGKCTIGIGSSTSGPEGPFGGTPAAIPGTALAEKYDTGGQGVGYNVTSINGTDNAYRSDGVDLETTSAPGGGNDVGWTATGQWFRYTVNVATAGTYNVTFEVASPTGVTDGFHLASSAGTNLTGSVNVPNTGGWQTWTTVTATVTLPAGQQVLTWDQDNGGFNLYSMTFAATGASCTTVPSAPTGLAATATSSSQINLNWTAVTPPANCTISSYSVYRSTTSGFTPSSSNLIASGVTSTSYSNTGLTASTTYYYVVEAVDAAGSSAASMQASATTSAASMSCSSICIDSGSTTAVSSFAADKDFSGGATINHANTINTSKVTNPAPAAVYQTARVTATVGAGTTFSYTIPGFTAGSSHTVRLHFCETYWTAAGKRQFNVSINGTQVLANFDIFATAGGQNIANIQQFTETANVSGQYVLAFTSDIDKALISGIEID